MRLTRRRFLGGAAAAALGGGGVYELVDQLVSGPKRHIAEPAGMPVEQHVFDLGTVQSEGVEVVVPPLHSEVITATVAAGNVRTAQRDLEDALRELDARYELNPKGLGVTIAWGLPYFDTYVSAQAKQHLPHDRRANKSALLPSRTFPSDPTGTLLERNDVAVLLRSDHREHIHHARSMLFDDLHVFTMTSIRRGFAGGGFGGGQSLPQRMAVAAGVPGADLIPDGSELFLGFTSTQKAGLGPRLIANHETLGFVDTRSGYFHGGTHMHLSHISEDLEAWYLNFDFDERLLTAFRPGMTDVKQGAQTIPQGPDKVSSPELLQKQFKQTGRFGHSASIQATSRLKHDFVGADGTHYPKGTAIPQRADFNTLDNPFAWTAHPQRDKFTTDPIAGVHFVVFNPSSDDFERNRLAMDGVLPDGTKLFVPPRTRAQGFNSVLTTTHRQNFLVPPRRHRSFPLAEL
ncbi:MAG TPA: twin-arginine translocation signal domain-containing protein [Gaiellaceae bacterium]|nr:twin-arginine translocation signal domain-containing protein [Gaiellaceae bacterium]